MKMMTVRSIEVFSGAPLRELKSIIRKALHTEIKVFVFGSFARGDFLPESDIDILIAVPDDILEQKKNQIREIVWKYSDRYNVIISPVIVSFSDLENSSLPLIRKAMEEWVEI